MDPVFTPGTYLSITGGTLTGALTITNATDSSSTSTGCLILSGGLGIAKNLYAGGQVVITGTTPSAPNAGEVKIGGGQIWQGAGWRIGQWGIISTWARLQHEALSELAGNYGLMQNSDGSTLLNCTTGQFIALRCNNVDVLSYNDGADKSVTVKVTAPASVSAGEVKIGGGTIRAATAIYCPTPTAGDNSTLAATTAFVSTAVSSSSGGSAIAPIATFIDPGYEWTAIASTTGNNWGRVSCSANGDVIATYITNGQLYISNDNGTSFTARDSNRNWQKVAMSQTGQKMVAVVSGGYIYTSTDTGATWTQRDSSRGWFDCASSADGKKLIALDSGGYIYTSTDSGINWTQRAISASWYSCASSSDGTILYATVGGGSGSGYIYVSKDSGVTWNSYGSNIGYGSVACSADGTRAIVARPGTALVYRTLDAGLTWTSYSGSRDWRYCAISADGTKVYCSVFNGQIYTTYFYLDTLLARDSNRNWSGLCCTATGDVAYATVDTTGSVYKSSTSLQVNSSRLISTSKAFANGAAAATGTLTNAPAAGNPTKWIPINDNGTTRYIPAW